MNITLEKYDEESVKKCLGELLANIYVQSEKNITATICLLNHEETKITIMTTHHDEMVDVLRFALREAVLGSGEEGLEKGLIQKLNRLKQLLQKAMDK